MFAPPLNDRMVRIPYRPNLFSGSGTLLWTVEQADYDNGGGLWIASWGQMLMVNLHLNTCTTSGSGNQLILTVPGGYSLTSFVPLGLMQATISGTWANCKVYTSITQPDKIRFYRIDESNWPAVTNTLYMRGSLMLPLV